jgi:mono/diheme cytochrome c family protein
MRVGVALVILLSCARAIAQENIEREPQREGDAARGYDMLVNGGYVSCGLPISAYRRVFGPAPPRERVAGRTGANAELPYNFTATTTARGVEVVASNCLTCHAAELQGELVIGLGAHSSDFTHDVGMIALASRSLVDDDPNERAEWQRWATRVRAVAPHIRMHTIGPTPADNLAAVLFAHRDPRTLAWQRRPRLVIPRDVVPVDVPAWWLLRHRNAMFHTGSGRGDHARLMMSASMLCTDTVAEARAIDERFADVRAYILSLRAPRHPDVIDAALAVRGRAVYERTCAACHGRYEGGVLVYPNRVIPLSEIGTDARLAEGAGYFSAPYRGWFASSFWGERARLVPTGGYVAPPLDGVWATAPYFHNGSVPTIEAVLDSRARPRYWTRSFRSTDYDPDALGWRYRELAHGKSGAATAYEALRIYDTTEAGYGNGGHTYGDALDDEERRALLEYLKSL